MPLAARRRASSSSRVARSAPIPPVTGDLNLAISAAVRGISCFDPENGHRSPEKYSPNKRLSVRSQGTKLAPAGEWNSPGSGLAEEFGNRPNVFPSFSLQLSQSNVLQPKDRSRLFALNGRRQGCTCSAGEPACYCRSDSGGDPTHGYPSARADLSRPAFVKVDVHSISPANS